MTITINLTSFDHTWDPDGLIPESEIPQIERSFMECVSEAVQADYPWASIHVSLGVQLPSVCVDGPAYAEAVKIGSRIDEVIREVFADGEFLNMPQEASKEFQGTLEVFTPLGDSLTLFGVYEAYYKSDSGLSCYFKPCDEWPEFAGDLSGVDLSDTIQHDEMATWVESLKGVE